MSNLFTVREIIIAVKNLDEACNDYRGMGFREVARGELPDPPFQARFIYLALGEGTVPVLTLMESLGPGSPIEKFIEKKGEGLFSVALGVTSLDEFTERAKARGAEFVLDSPQELEDGTTPFHETFKKMRINWVRPKGPTHGMTLELHEMQWD